MRRLTRLLVVLLSATVGSAALADCATAKPMTAQQMACCAAMDYACHRNGRDEACCPTVSHTGDQLLASALPQLHPVLCVVVGPTAWTASLKPPAADEAAMTAIDRMASQSRGRPIYLLVSLLLI